MNKLPKNKLAYSPLTDTVKWIDGRGQTREIHQNFLQVMLLWFHGSYPEMKSGQKFERSLRVKGKPHWKFTIERVLNKPSEEQTPCPTCGTPCTISWSGLDLVANTGDETLASKHYHPVLSEREQLQKELSEAVGLLRKALPAIGDGFTVTDEIRTYLNKIK